jgi:hypothetical protein
MRLWTLHPRYLDPQGLVALWREALLAKAVLRGETRGYRHHPQLQRFQKHEDPRAAVNAYLVAVHVEASTRGYTFDPAKLDPEADVARIVVTSGQVDHEWRHLLAKLATRNPDVHRRWSAVRFPDPHPLFTLVDGPVELWERNVSPASTLADP